MKGKISNKLLNENKGITLIALVITIVVLLILAGVTIAMLTGENGILTQAQNAKTVTENKNAEEKVKLAIMAARSQTQDASLNLDKLKTEVTTNYGGQVEGTEFPVTVVIDGKSFRINSEGNEFEEKVTIEEGNGTNVGDVIAVTSTKGTTEEFYVLSYDEGTKKAKALAKYNLMVGEIYDSNGNKTGDVDTSATKYGLQEETMKGWVEGQGSRGTVAFSSSKYWDGTYTPQGNSSYPWVYNNKSNLYQYVESYKTLLGNTDKVSEVSLASYEDIKALWSNKSSYPWLCNTTFWLGSASSSSYGSVWGVITGGYFSGGISSTDSVLGVRPVITVDMLKI